MSYKTVTNMYGWQQVNIIERSDVSLINSRHTVGNRKLALSQLQVWTASVLTVQME